MSTETEHLQPVAESTETAETAPVESGEVWVRTATYYGPDRRHVRHDRRALGFFSLRQLSFKGERKTNRRAEDHRTPYVDWYEPKLMVFVVGVMILACVDALLTPQLWQQGLVELNYLMAELINDDMQRYINLKLAVTALALCLLVIYKNFPVYRFFRVYQLIYLLFGLYCALVLGQVHSLVNSA